MRHRQIASTPVARRKPDDQLLESSEEALLSPGRSDAANHVNAEIQPPRCAMSSRYAEKRATENRKKSIRSFRYPAQLLPCEAAIAAPRDSGPDPQRSR